MVQKLTDLVNKQWVKLFRDLLLVGELKSPLEWDPVEC